MKRYYALLLHRDGELQLIRMKDDETVLASCPYQWHFGGQYELELKAEGHRLTASVNGKQMLEETQSADADAAEQLGVTVANALISKGALELLN